MDDLEHKINYQFGNKELLKTALTHRSSLNEQGIKESNERLEFLGDAVLELVITNFLYHERPNDPEGVLTSARSVIVRTDSLAAVAKSIDLGSFIKMSRGEAMTGGRENNAILENTVEALIGAIYQDGGLEKAKKFIEESIIPQAREILSRGELKDPKSLLQERVQARGLVSPNYRVVKESGPDHDKIFEVSVEVNNKEVGRGEGKSKQEAEQRAAQKALDLV
ncbi:ribonuclease III [Candidatus Collierbacteria bacterium]|nr:ribonuclease III [Candidatus Collierbacteria bacterium]